MTYRPLCVFIADLGFPHKTGILLATIKLGFGYPLYMILFGADIVL